MALVIKYKFNWVDAVTGDVMRYDILKEGATGEPVILSKAGDVPIQITSEGRNIQTLQPGIHGTEAKIQLRTETGLRMSNFVTEDPKMFRLDVYKNGVLQFSGFAKPFLYDEPLRDGNYTFELSFTDGLGDLSRLKLKKAGVTPSQPINGVELLALCLQQTGLNLPVVIVDYLYHDTKMGIGENPETRSAWDEWQWDALRFFDGSEPWDVYRILENLCRRRTGILRMAEGKWWFIRIPDYRITPFVIAWQYDKDGLNGTSFDWYHTKTISLTPDMGDVDSYSVLKGFDANRKSWNPSLKRVQHRINYGHFRNQLLGTIFDGSLNYKYSATSGSSNIDLPTSSGALALTSFKIKGWRSDRVDSLPDNLPRAYSEKVTGYRQYRELVKASHVDVDTYVRFAEVAVKPSELVRVSVRLKNVDLWGGKICVVCYPFANLPQNLDTLTDDSKRILSITARRFLSESGEWVANPTAIVIQNTTLKEISGNSVEVADEERTFTVTSQKPYPLPPTSLFPGVVYGPVVRFYLMPGAALGAPQGPSGDRYVLYDEIALETSQFFKDKKITAHEVRVENTANEFGENQDGIEVEIGETLNTLNYAYPVGISNDAIGLSSGQWFEHASIGEGFRSQNEWAAYSELRMRQSLQMLIQGVIRGESYGPHNMFKFFGGGAELDGRLFLCLSYGKNPYDSVTDVVFTEWQYSPVSVTISRKGTTGTESTPLGSGSSFENWYRGNGSGGIDPDTRGGRIGIPESGGGGGIPNSTDGSGGVLSDEEDELYYKNRRAAIVPYSVLDLAIGSHEADHEDWDGIAYAPYGRSPKGIFDVVVGGDLIEITYTDSEGFQAVYSNSGGQRYLETNDETGEEVEKVTEPGEFPPVWTYLRTEEQPEYDDAGFQLTYGLSIERGKVRESVSRAIRKGAEYKGVFTVGDVLYAIPSVPENRPSRAVEGFAVWDIENWSNVIHGPNNWTGPGLLVVGFFGDSVIFEAYNDTTSQYSYALKPNAASPLGPWQQSGGLYFTKDEILYLLSQYAQKDHAHDDRYPTITYLLNLLNNYQSAVWRPTVEEVIGLNYALSQLVSKDLFNSGDYGFLAGVGEDNQAALFDMSKTKVNAGVLSVGKVGSPYFYLISKDEILYPRGAINKTVVAPTLEPWLTVTWNPSVGLIFEGTPDETGKIVVAIRVGYRLSARSQFTYETHVVMFRILAADAVITAPTAPGSFTATAISSTAIDLIWTDSANENVYEVWVRPVGGGYVKIATLPANTLHFEHTGLTPETTYEYELRAVNSTGTATATDSATTLEAVVIESGSLYGRYFNAVDLDETVGETGHRNDAIIDFSWNGAAPFAGVSGSAFSLRESGFVTVPVNGNYQFRFTANDGIRVWMNGQTRIDKWQERAATSEVFSLNLLANSPVSIIIEYYNSGSSGAALKMEILQGANYIVIPSAYLTPDPALGVKINVPVLSATAADAVTVDLDWTFGGAVSLFNMKGGLTAGNLADIGNVAGTDRERIVGGLPTGQTFYFQIRAVNNSGRFGGWSNVATVTLSNSGTNPNPADPVIIARGGTDNIIVTASDNNEGSDESYEYNFRAVGETDWKTLKADFSLSSNLSEFGLFSNGPVSIIAPDFEGKRMETRVRVHKSGLLSGWSSVVRELPVTPVAQEIICFPGKFNVRQNADGSYSDIAVQEEGGFRAFYTIDVAYDTSFYNPDGTPKSFTNVFLPNDSLLSLRKIMMNKSVFPTVQAFKTMGWLANIGADESLIGDCSGAIVRTGNVTGGGGPVDQEEPPQVRVIDHMQTMVVPAMLYIMNYGSFRTDEIKEKMTILKNSGYKGVAITFTPFKVWSNYTSPGAFDPNNLTFDPTELNKIIFHCCNTLGMKLFVRLDANFSAFALRNMGNTTTDDLLNAWDSYFYHKDGEPNSLRFDNTDTPPWQLFKKFCAWFRGQYNNYWQSGKMQMWEGGYEFHQEMTYNPESWDLSYPTPSEYAERTQDLYDANEALRTAMGDWGDEFSGDAVCNVGSVSDVLAIGLRNTVDYHTYAQNYRGLKSNHGSDWTQDERDLSDMILYSWAQVNYNTFGITHRYFAVEYFKEGNQFTVSGMADSIERTLNNGALYVYAIFDGPINEFQNFYGQLASMLTTRGAMDKRRVFPQTNGNIFISVEAARTNGIFQQLGSNPSVLQTWLNQKNANNGVPVRVYIED